MRQLKNMEVIKYDDPEEEFTVDPDKEEVPTEKG